MHHSFIIGSWSRGHRRSATSLVFYLCTCFCLWGCEAIPELEGLLVPSGQGELSEQSIAAGLREALDVGSGRAVDSLGRADGFLNSAFHIPLPEELRQARAVAASIGLDGIFEDLEVRLNRAAEAAAPQAKALFVNAVRQLTFQDVMSIYSGADDAATQYMRRTTEARLRAQMRPIIDRSLSEVGALRMYEDLVNRYNRIPLVQPLNADVTGHVLTLAGNALLTRLAQEEGAIRREPAKRTTQLLRQVFGNRY